MYEQFYGLREKPFSLTPDTDFFYRDRVHQEALNVLTVALNSGEGFVQVVGGVGTGKTLLCRQFLHMLQETHATAYLPNPLLTPVELYRAITDDLELEIPPYATAQQFHKAIFTALISLKEAGRPLVVLIDEAQVMPIRSLEALRLLSNLETRKEKLLHIVFFAQAEFEQRLAKDNLRQLRQRITFTYTLRALPSSDLAAYLDHRLQVAGYQGNSLFTPAAVKLLYRASKGVPRVINLLAHKALMVGYGKGVRKITGQMVGAAIKDTAGVCTGGTWFFGRRPLHMSALLMRVAIVATFAFAVFVWGMLR
jgi:MSHA biogenesis protein MshM